jgi:hypothetical protein
MFCFILPTALWLVPSMDAACNSLALSTLRLLSAEGGASRAGTKGSANGGFSDGGYYFQVARGNRAQIRSKRHSRPGWLRLRSPVAVESQT